MSLADQQWCPTSVQVTVLQARGLRTKGKSGTNDAYAVMQVGKEKYQTSVVEKSVAPVWKEEAAFDLPPLHLGGGGGGGGRGGGGGELHVHVLHRALVGPDKQLGQAVINLLQLSEDKTRNKTEWFKLLDKTGKADKDRGEVLLDIQFMRNNMTASMFDLSAAGKSRSRLGKLKDKVRGKKKESDTVSSVVPSFSQVLTDSEDEANGEVAAGKDEKKKKNKMKSLFSPKSNLQKNMSQSMSILPGKNSSLSGSQSSGLNVDSSEGKKKFKFMIHKRSGSSDSKDSSSGHQKHGDVEQSNVCINGSHVYCEEPPSRTSRIGSNFSLASSGHGSMEDVPESSPPSVDSLRAMRQYSPWTEEEEEEMAEVENTSEDVDELRREEEERIRIEEERRRKEEEEERERRGEEERERLAEEKRRLEEQERMRIEEEEKRQREERIREEERRRKEEEEERQKEALERLAEEKRRQEEEDRKRIEEEKERIQREEEMKRWEEQERVKREEEERERLAEEKRRLEEQERRRIEEEEKRQREEEERIRVEEERAREERRRQEEEERVRRQEERKLAEEKRRMEEERRIEEAKVRKEEEERIRREEERVEEERRKEEEERVRREEEHEKKRRLEEQERSQREEKERIRKEEERRREEARKEKEEYERMVEEKRKLEEKERERIETEEKIRREEEERIRMEEERRRKEEEAERVRREEEECEEKRRLEEQERKRIEEEERARKEKEEMERLLEETRRLEEERRQEEERIREEEEERIRIEEERRRKEEEERARKEKEEMERLLEEKRRLEEERRQEEERIREEEEERIRIEEERSRQEEEERARKEKEEMERSAEEKRRLEEQEKRKIEEEERIRKVEKAERERKEEETKKLEKEKLARDAEEQKKRENKTKAAWQKLEVAVESPAHSTSTNPFDEDFSNNPFDEIPSAPTGPDSSTARVSDIQQGCQSAVLSVRSKTVSTDEKDLISTQREKRPAPQPPGRNQAESQREQDVATRHQAQINKQSNDKDIKTASVLPQRWTQMTSPLSQSPPDTKNTQSVMQSSSTKGTQSAAKHSKRPAPPRPRSVEEEPSSEPKTGNISQRVGSETKQVPVVYGLNPFEDDEEELTAQDDTKTPGNTGSIPWPPAVSPAADKDAASQAKLKSSKVAHAPPPPAKKAATSSTSIHQNTDVMDDAGAVVRDNGANETCDPQPEAIISVPVQGTSVKEPQPARAQELPPTTSRRLQPVKPLNPPDQQSVSIVQGEKYNQSTGILSEVQERTKVNDTGLKGPYSQLTREELISLVLKQEKQLSERDKKISELEQYIDNLLVRVMEEKPSILMSLNSLKKAV